MLEQLKKEYKEACRLHTEAFKNAPLDLSFMEYEKYMNKTGDKVEELSRKIRMIDNYELSDIPKYGSRMKLSDFIENVKSGGFIDYDGTGNYVKDNKMVNITIYPSDVEKNSIRKDFNEIVWFNR
jgi:hypothetical protein